MEILRTLLLPFREYMEVWLSRSHSLGWETGREGMPNSTGTKGKSVATGLMEGWIPPQSLDLNIIEAVWDRLDRERKKRQPKSKEELWGSGGFKAVLKNKDAHTKYCLVRIVHTLSFSLVYTYFNKSLQPFPTFLAIHEEMRGGSRLLYSTVHPRHVCGWGFETAVVSREFSERMWTCLCATQFVCMCFSPYTQIAC